MYDLIIRDALIYDGSGAAPFHGNVAVNGDKIAAVSREDLGTAATVVDAKGLCLAPGFIDTHSHADYAIFDDPHRLHVLRMGCTTEIGGQCGKTPSPLSPDQPEKVREFLSPNKNVFATFREQIEATRNLPLGPNQIYFMGHGGVRGNAMGLQSRHATEEELQRMERDVAQGMEDGALGISTGLSYVPGIYSDTEELTRLGSVAGKYGGIYTTHSRSESMGLFDSVAECIHIAREGKVPVNISHFKCVGKVFWERCGKALSMIDEALEEGLDITLDAYPYVATSTTTLSTIPPKFLDQGAEAFAKMLEDPEIVEQIRKEIFEINDPSWDNSMYYVGLENFLIVRAKYTPWAVGMTYAQVGEQMGIDPFYAVVDLLKKNHGSVTECRFSMCEENVEQILKHPKCMVGSDGIYLITDTTCHPRATGTFPRYLGHYVRDRGILSREEGIHRITGMPAKRYGLQGKGSIAAGMDADLVLFDYDTIIDGGDFVDPFKPNKGIHQVYVGGKLTLQDNEPTGTWNGKYLR